MNYPDNIRDFDSSPQSPFYEGPTAEELQEEEQETVCECGEPISHYEFAKDFELCLECHKKRAIKELNGTIGFMLLILDPVYGYEGIRISEYNGPDWPNATPVDIYVNGNKSKLPF